VVEVRETGETYSAVVVLISTAFAQLCVLLTLCFGAKDYNGESFKII